MKTVKVNIKSDVFHKINVGLKTVEGRLRRGKFKDLNKGDIIIWNGVLATEIIRVSHYPSIGKMLIAEKVDKVLPDAKSLSDGIRIYRQYYSIEDDKRFGIVALQLEVIDL